MTSTAVEGSPVEDDIVTMEPVDEEQRGGMEPRLFRILFFSLAGIALVALAAVVLVILLAPASTVGLLFTALGVLVLVIIAEILLLLLGRPRTG